MPRDLLVQSPDMDYGWIRPSPDHKWHRVESMINGDSITACGRRIKRREGDESAETAPFTRMIGQPDICHGGCLQAA